MARLGRNDHSHLLCCILATDAPATCAKNNEEVNRQQVAKRMKREIARDVADQKAAKKMIEWIYFRKMYDTKYCMKGDPKVVAQN
jgi:hypothetical protein